MAKETMKVTYRLIKESEYPFLKEMLYEALFVPEEDPKFPKSILMTPEIKRYIDNWNEFEDDIAIVAIKDHKKLIGAVWGRKFKSKQQGYGYVDESTPEISIAIDSRYRNLGIGTVLLSKIETEYSRLKIYRLSLSVDVRSPAKRLYERIGYEPYRIEEKSIVMLKNL